MEYKKYAKVEGVTMDSLNGINTDAYTIDSMAHGLTIDISFRCESGEMICQNFNSDNDSSRSLAIAYALKVAKSLIDGAISTNKINAATTIDRNELLLLSDLYEMQFRQYMQYALQEMNFDSSDCFFCNSNTIQMNTIELTGNYRSHEPVRTYQGVHHSTMAMPLSKFGR